MYTLVLGADAPVLLAAGSKLHMMEAGTILFTRVARVFTRPQQGC